MPIAVRAVRDNSSPPQGRIHFLDVPFEARTTASKAGAVWDIKLKAWIFKGTCLPPALNAYASEPYSWQRYRENSMSPDKARVASPPSGNIVMRKHQTEGAAAIKRAYDRDFPGFLLADDVGLGKTITAWAGVLDMEDTDSVLVVCPLAVTAHWRRTISLMGDGGKQIVVINYDRLKSLFEVPPIIPSVKKGRRTSKRKVRTGRGVARFGEACAFDIIIWDESHKLKRVESVRSRLSLKLGQQADFVLRMSATAGQNPLELSYLSPLLAHASGENVRDLADFEQWCLKQDIGLKRGKFGKWEWCGNSPDPEIRKGAEKDLLKMRDLLFGGHVPAGIRRSPTDIAGWPEVNRILMPAALGTEDRILYNAVWSEFRRDSGLEGRGKDSSHALVQQLRFRQKSSLLRTAATVDMTIDFLEQGFQVAVSVAFIETLNVIKDALEGAGYGVSVISGSVSPGLKEEARLDFQHGRTSAVIYTVEEGISLHQGEYNDVRRVNVIHDLRWSGIAMKQIEGRTHRDGRFSQIYWMLGEGTVEEAIAAIVAGRISSMSTMHGDDETVRDIEKLLLNFSI